MSEPAITTSHWIIPLVAGNETSRCPQALKREQGLCRLCTDSGNNGRACDVKRYYIDVERYDWVDVTDNFKGIESIFHRNRTRVMINFYRKYAEGNPVLDVGCGTGLILRKLPTSSIGLDINPWAVEKAREHAPGSQLVIADAEAIPFRDSSVTTVICTETIEHLPEPGTAIREIHRLLKQEGKLIGSVPHDIFLWKLRVLSSTCPHSEPFHNQFKLKEMQKLLDAFKIVHITTSLLGLNIVFVTEKEASEAKRGKQ